MKKIIMMVIGFACFGLLQAGAEVSVATINAAKSNGVEAVSALLPQCETVAQSNGVKFAIVSFERTGNFKSKAVALGLPDQLIKLFAIRDSNPNSAERNSAIREYLAAGGSDNWVFRFDPRVATVKECVEVYELILKNVALTEATKDRLGQVKGELLKLKEI